MKQKGIISVHTTPLSPAMEDLLRLNNLLYWCLFLSIMLLTSILFYIIISK